MTEYKAVTAAIIKILTETELLPSKVSKFVMRLQAALDIMGNVPACYHEEVFTAIIKPVKDGADESNV